MSDENKKGLSNGDKNTPEVVDTRTVADKDGTKVEPKPNDQFFIFSPDFSPAGSSPVKTKVAEKNAPEPTKPDVKDVLRSVDLSRDDIDIEEKYRGCNVLLKLSNEPNNLCLDGGRISRMTVTKGKVGDEEILAHFDHGKWVKEPKTFLTKQAVMEAKQKDNGVKVAEPQKEFEKSHDPDIDI